MLFKLRELCETSGASGASGAGIRQCTNDDAATGKGGNPVGCGFQFTADAGGLIRALSCKDEAGTCLGVDGSGRVDELVVVPCGDPRATGWSAHPTS